MGSLQPFTPRALAQRIRELSLFEGRPVRETAISSDEVMNLVIVLNTAGDVNDFLTQI